MLKSFKQYNSTLHVDGDMTDQKAHSHSKRNGEGENPSHEAQLGLIRTQLLTQHPAIQLPEQPVPSNIIGDNHPSIPSRNQVRRVVRSAKRAQGLCKKPRTRDQSTKNNLDGRSAIVPERRISLHHPKKGQSQQWSQTRTSYSTLDTVTMAQTTGGIRRQYPSSKQNSRIWSYSIPSHGRKRLSDAPQMHYARNVSELWEHLQEYNLEQPGMGYRRRKRCFGDH